MTIDELARESGVTSRNIRAYQTRGLLAPPRVEGRVGYYDDTHLARLRYVNSLQERGFSLAAIQVVLEAWDQGRNLTDVLGFEEALTAPWTDEKPERVPLDRLLAMFPEAVNDPRLIERAIELGLLVAVDGGELEAPSPRLLRVGAELVAAGIPLAAALDEYEPGGRFERIGGQRPQLHRLGAAEPAGGEPLELLLLSHGEDIGRRPDDL